MIQSALSLIRLKRELRPEHYAKLTTALTKSVGDANPTASLTKLSRNVADMVSKYRLGTSECRSLAAVLNRAMKPAELSGEKLSLTIADTRGPFRRVKATDDELNALEKSLRLFVADSTFDEFK
jgi:hypothetical protein